MISMEELMINITVVQSVSILTLHHILSVIVFLVDDIIGTVLFKFRDLPYIIAK